MKTPNSATETNGRRLVFSMDHDRQPSRIAGSAVAAASISPSEDMMTSSAVSAQVLVDAAASEDQIAGLQADFAAQGLDVGPVVGNNFSITGSPRDFLQLFDIETDGSGTPGGPTTAEAVERLATDRMLPLDSLPLRDRHLVSMVVIPSKPDFGPSNP